jgi:toxin YoeB
MNLTFGTDKAFDDFTSWALQDKKIYKKILTLIKDIKRDPYSGIGKPEQLKYDLFGYWSRRITDEEHRLVYQVVQDTVIILSCKEHYQS